MEKKKIILVAYACSPKKGSEEGNGWSWATGLAKLGFEIWCFTNIESEIEITEANKRLNYPNLRFIFIRLSRFLDGYLLNPDSKGIYIHYALWKLKSAKVAKAMHKQIHFDIGHHVTYGSLQQGNFLWRLKGIKIVFGPVGGGQKPLSIFKAYFGKAWYFEIFRNIISSWTIILSKNFRKSLQSSNHLLVTNHDTYVLALKSTYIEKENIFLVPDHAISKSVLQPKRTDKLNNGPLKLLWVGRILPRKGLNLVLEAISRLPDDVNYILTIVGGGELFPLINHWISLYKLNGENIRVTGRIPFQDVKNHYLQSDVFIFCSLRDSFAIQLSEAMAFGLPVITLNLHGAGDWIPTECGIKITPVSKEQTLNEIAQAIIKMKIDDEFRIKCAKMAYQHSQRNTWEDRIKYVVEKFY